MARRLLSIAGLGAVGGVGYYMYAAGGDPKIAERRFERDAHRAASDVKGMIPRRAGTDAEKEGKTLNQEARVKFDSAVANANQELSKAKSETETYAKGVTADAMKKIEEIDRKVEESAAKAKSGILSWFGGK